MNTQPAVAFPVPADPPALCAPDRPDPTTRRGRCRAAVARVAPLASLVAWLYLALMASLGGWVAFGALALGWRPVVVTGESMEPAMRRGDVVMTAPLGGEPPAPGTALVFRDPRDGAQTIHRVVAVNHDGTLRTRGDANRSEDPDPVPTEQVIGVGRLLVPFVGFPLAWWHGGQVPLAAAWGGLSVLAVATLVPRRPRRSPGRPAAEAG